MRHQQPADHGGPSRPRVDHVECTETVGTVHFAGGQLTMKATNDALILRVEASDADSLRRLQDGIAARLQTIGRRDRLTVTWFQLETDQIPPDEVAYNTESVADNRRWHRRLVVAGMAIGGALIVALHVGFGGAALAAASWTGPVAATLLVFVLAAIVFGAVHVILGRLAFRRGTAIHTRWRSRESGRHKERQ
jgi:hypothetical protein